MGLVDDKTFSSSRFNMIGMILRRQNEWRPTQLPWYYNCRSITFIL